MGGGLIQLVAYGVQDLYLTNDPQITYWKIVYRRHTNFATEPIAQPFLQTPDFGQRVTATITKIGDLVTKMYLLVTLPCVPQFIDKNTGKVNDINKFAWAKKIGYAIIDNIEIEIGGQLIDRHFGDWLNIWSELTLATEEKNRALNIMIGNVELLTSFTNGKPSYDLFIPLQFWCCRNNGLAIPLVAMQYSDLKIHVTFNRAEDCYIIGPTNYILIDEDAVLFTKNEFIQQTINNVTSTGLFIDYDFITKRFYYIKIDGFFRAQTDNDDIRVNNFSIRGLNSNSIATPILNTIERTIKVELGHNISIVTASILVDYVFLDNEERIRFAHSNHEYLIDQVQSDGNRTIVNSNVELQLGYSHPTKEIIWVTQFNNFSGRNFKDKFNYTNSFDSSIGKNITGKAKLLLNGQERLGEREGNYYNLVQIWQNHTNAPKNSGINIYSFSIDPEGHQPSGSLNLSKIDDAKLTFQLDRNISYSNPATMRIYAVSYNVLRIVNGLGGLAFSN